MGASRLSIQRWRVRVPLESPKDIYMKRKVYINFSNKIMVVSGSRELIEDLIMIHGPEILIDPRKKIQMN